MKRKRRMRESEDRANSDPQAPAPAETTTWSRDASAAALLASAYLVAPNHWNWGWRDAIGPAIGGGLAFLLLVQTWKSHGREWSQRLGRALLCVALAASTAPILNVGISWWEDRAPSFPTYSLIAAPILSAIGYPASESQGLLHINHKDGLLTVAPSMEKTAARGFLIFVGLWLTLRAARDPRRLGKGLALVASAALIASLVRYVCLLAVYLEFTDILASDPGEFALSLLSSPWTTAPFLIIAGALLDFELSKPSRNPQPQDAPTPEPRRKPGVARLQALAILCGVLGGVVVICATLRPPGEEKSGRVLIDDRFGGMWEPTARMLDTEWYGDFATYSFSSLAEWLGHWCAVDVNTSKIYSDDLLRDYDVLILKTPVEPIAQAEQDAIDRFVRSGGGLMLVGDHTNLLGMGAHLNKLSAKYGIKFRYDAVSDQSGAFVNCGGRTLGRHPAAIEVDNLEFMTSCSLEISGSAETVLAADHCRRDPHDYANPSFFGRQGPHPEIQQGRAVLCATAPAGAGRIAAFTDSTVWSSFAVFQHDREKLAFNLVGWLNRKPSRVEPSLRLAAILGLGLLIILAIIPIRTGGGLPVLLAAVSGIWAGSCAVELAHRAFYERPQPFAPVSEVSFLWQGGACAFPPTLGTLGSLPADRAFDTAYISTQRLGLTPRVARTYASAFSQDTKTLVLIAPVDPPPLSVLKRLRAFVDNGGSLVVIDDSRYNELGSANRWLLALDMHLTYRTVSTPDGQGAQTQVVLPPEMTLTPTPDPSIFLGIGKFGKGQAAYLIDAPFFSRSVMGHSFARPWKRSKACYDVIFQVFRDHLKVAPPERRFYRIL